MMRAWCFTQSTERGARGCATQEGIEPSADASCEMLCGDNTGGGGGGSAGVKE
jgi:hypothetical protein